MVGDELQSIYGFRHADLDVFRRAREEIDRRADAELMRAQRQLPLAAGGDRRGQPLRRGAARRRLPAAAGRGGAVRGAGGRRRGAGGRAAADRPRRLGRRRDRAGAGDRRRHPAQLPGRGALRRRSGCASWPTQASRAARWSSCCAPSPTSTPTRTRSNAPACVPTWSAAAATGPSSRSPTSAPCWRRSPTRSTTTPSSAPSPRPPAAVAPDTLWLLRAAAGKRRHVWPAVERAAGAGEAELAEPERLEDIPAAERELLARLRRADRLAARARHRGSRWRR